MKKRILFAASDLSGCGTYRAIYPGRALMAAGYECVLTVPQLLNPTATYELAETLAGFSAVVLQRPVGAGHWWASICKEAGVPVLVELDDDLWHVPHHNPGFAVWGSGKMRALTTETIRLADRVIVSTDSLRDVVVAEAGVDPARVVVAPNHLRVEVWGDAAMAIERLPREPGSLIIGWQGSCTHDTDFCVVVPALRQILKDYPHVQVRFFGSFPRPMWLYRSDRFEFTPWASFKDYPKTLRYLDFDIGLAPLTDNAFNRSKSPLKYLEYAAIRVPTVASDCLPYRVIQHGVTGMLCRTSDDWYAALKQLIDNAGWRRAMGLAAHAAVWRDWGPHRGLAWVQLFHDLFTTVTAEDLPPCRTVEITDEAAACA